jgi:hypothetical protein
MEKNAPQQTFNKPNSPEILVGKNFDESNQKNHECILCYFLVKTNCEFQTKVMSL